MNIEYVYYFLHVVQSGSINKTAKHYLMPHQSISFALKKLEDDLGYPLLVRTPRGVHLTEEAENVLDSFKTIAVEHQKLMGLNNNVHGLSGNLSIVMAPYYSYVMTNDFWVTFLNLNSDLSLTLKTLENRDIYNQILKNEGNYDTYFMVFAGDAYTSLDQPLINTNWHTEFLLEDKLLATISRKHPLSTKESLTLDELCQYKYSYFQSSNSTENITFGFFEDFNNVEIKLCTDNLANLISVIINSDSFAMLPSLIKLNTNVYHNENLRFIPITGLPSIKLYFLHRKDITPEKQYIVTMFLRQLRRHVNKIT